MALWNGSAINTTETAMVFNQLYNLQAIMIIRFKNGLLYKVLGKMDKNSIQNGKTKFERSSNITGKNIEVKLLGALPATTKVTDGSSEIATVTPVFNASEYGAAEFPLTHYTLTKAIPKSQARRYKGKSSKTDDFYAEIFRGIMAGYENDIGNDLSGQANTGTIIGRTQLGSWLFGISTGGGAGGTDATGETASAYRYYGTIDRQDAANSNFCAVVDAAYGASTLAKLRLKKNLVDVNQGTTDTLVMGTTLYTTHELLVEPYTIVTNAPEMVDFGGNWFRYGGMDFMHESRAPAGTIGGIDSTTWVWYDNDDELTGGMVLDPSRVASYVVPTERWSQFICIKPNSNWKALNAF